MNDEIFNPVIKVINGSGTPRFVVPRNAVYTSSILTTITDTTITEADSTPININSYGTYPPYNIEMVTSSANAFSIGQWVLVAGVTGSAPDINGLHQVDEVFNNKHFIFRFPITTAGTGGTVKHVADAELNGVYEGQKVASVWGGPDGLKEVTWAKVIGIDGNVVTIDEWTAGTPSNGATLIYGGDIVDLPYCKEMTEAFIPYTIIHNLYRGRHATKEYGYSYECTLDYSAHLFGARLYALSPIFNVVENTAIQLIPHKDSPGHVYNVYLKTNPIQMAMFGKGKGHKKLVFAFAGKELIPNLPFTTGYGVNYGRLYGTEL